MKEQVLMHKETGELLLLTNMTSNRIACEFMFLFHGGNCYILWNEEDFINLGEL